MNRRTLTGAAMVGDEKRLGGKVKEKEKEKKGALVIGGGVAGIQAALDLADADFQVHLVERASTMGGRMAQIDKTFPSMDCAI
jgi:heterodisulfide reductase subunit A